MDTVLKNACLGLKSSALKMIFGSLDGFLAKVCAFVGEIPTLIQQHQQHAMTSSSLSNSVTGSTTTMASHDTLTAHLSVELRNILKNQAFVKPDRLKETLEMVQQNVVQNTPDLRDMLKVFHYYTIASYYKKHGIFSQNV